eukprot:CAMPEP_0202881254 /NCGR_PEP_ID=MMETSP1391-20130828/36276_1 /ASSEMBLY_ACC=CAM_ASM_000867 /TAXON_ID=1034604 /ORGANISM="Chlamydomonas leiostraca, Strain SAG 11-49" /LENGTH=51 /DNA_ID=CAMNT_0049563909 /DNA_START=215 /DNA_END=367 /DNA_ORIENTATION=-
MSATSLLCLCCHCFSPPSTESISDRTADAPAEDSRPCPLSTLTPKGVMAPG